MMKCETCDKIAKYWREIRFLETDAYIAHVSGNFQEESDILAQIKSRQDYIDATEYHWCTSIDDSDGEGTGLV